jgi:hypothetical protein
MGPQRPIEKLIISNHSRISLSLLQAFGEGELSLDGSMALTRRFSHHVPNDSEDWSSRLVTRTLPLRPSKSPLSLSPAMLVTVNSSLEL